MGEVILTGPIDTNTVYSFRKGKKSPQKSLQVTLPIETLLIPVANVTSYG